MRGKCEDEKVRIHRSEDEEVRICRVNRSVCTTEVYLHSQ